MSPDDSLLAEPLRNLGATEPLGQVSQGPTGKGRGSMSAGMMDAELPGSTRGLEDRRTEGKLPEDDAGVKTMGPVNGPTGRLEPQRDSEELQRALEGELVGFLRQQNSKLMDELAYLRSKLDGGSNGKATSGMETSPWSEVDGSADSFRAFVGSIQPGRPGRHGSRTPRSKIREAAVSPGRKDHKRFTPNGTKVPDGPPPENCEPLPPVPPFPMMVENAQCGDGMHGSFHSDLYDTCESKPKAKSGDLAWKPRSEKRGEIDVLSPSEAKQIWLEREVQSLRHALDRVSVPKAIQTSDYWNPGYENRDVSPPSGSFPDTAGLAHDQRHRVFASAYQAPSGVRAVYEHGEHFERDRASKALHGEHLCQARAPAALHGEHLCQARAPAALHGGHLCQARAPAALHGGHLCQARASSALHGDHLCHARASQAVLGEVYGQGRAQHGAEELGSNLHDCRPARSCDLPRHGVGGGGAGDGTFPGRVMGQWNEGGNSRKESYRIFLQNHHLFNLETGFI